MPSRIEPGSPEWNENLDKFMDTIHHAIVEGPGWYAIAVFRGDGDDEPFVPFVYTVGVQQSFDHPELIMYGMPHETAHQIIACVIDLIKDGTRMEHGQTYDGVLQEPYKVKIWTHAREPLNMATNYYGEHPFDAVQVVWPDAWELFPDDDGCDEACRKVQVPDVPKQKGR